MGDTDATVERDQSRQATDRQWPEEGYTRIPSWVYTDPEIYQREMKLFFEGPTWNYIGLESEVPDVGSFRRTWIGEKSVVMVRTEGGEIAVLENRCAHRGAQICWQNSGKVKDFTCAYHQWNYALDGKLQGLPFRRGAGGKGGMPQDFDLAAHGLKRLRSVERGGTVWATYADNGPEFEDYCGADVMAEIDHLTQGKKLKVLGYFRQLIPSNWKMYLENLKDPYHATLLHTFYITFGLWRADSRSGNTVLDNGHSLMLSTNEGKKKSDATAEMARFDDGLQILDLETVQPRPDFNQGRVGGIWLFPAANWGTQGNSPHIRQIIPKGPGAHELVFTFYGFEDDDEDMTRVRIKHANLTGPAGFVSIDDSEMLTQVQMGATGYPDFESVVEMGGKDTEQTDYMVTEVMIRGFYKFYREAMGL